MDVFIDVPPTTLAIDGDIHKYSKNPEIARIDLEDHKAGHRSVHMTSQGVVNYGPSVAIAYMNNHEPLIRVRYGL